METPNTPKESLSSYEPGDLTKELKKITDETAQQVERTARQFERLEQLIEDLWRQNGAPPLPQKQLNTTSPPSKGVIIPFREDLLGARRRRTRRSHLSKSATEPLKENTVFPLYSVKMSDCDSERFFSSLVPQLKRYIRIKKEYQEHILFYQQGYIYEMFWEDAKIISSILGTSHTYMRLGNQARLRIAAHTVLKESSGKLLAKLIKAGRSVAICDQIDSGSVIPDHQVVRIISPGAPHGKARRNVTN